MDRRENVMALFNHQPHDHVVNYMTDICGCGGNLETFENGPLGGGYDDFGVLWHTSASAMGAGVPAAGHIVMEEIEDWRKLVKFPDVTKYDWEGQAREQLKNYDAKNQWLEYGMWNGHFLRLMHLMGFENGLIAMASEPEAVKEFMDVYTDYRISTIEYIAKYFKPDSICLFDDFATERGLFISPEAYRDMIKPYHTKLFNAIKSYGIIPNMHVCGLCEDVVEDFPDEGIHAWEVCQPENDLVGLQKKVGDKLAFIGGYDMIGKASYTETSEEELRASARETIDKYAPGGNFGFMGMIMYADPMKMISTMQILSDEGLKYGTDYYKK